MPRRKQTRDPHTLSAEAYERARKLNEESGTVTVRGRPKYLEMPVRDGEDETRKEWITRGHQDVKTSRRGISGAPTPQEVLHATDDVAGALLPRGQYSHAEMRYLKTWIRALAAGNVDVDAALRFEFRDQPDLRLYLEMSERIQHVIRVLLRGRIVSKSAMIAWKTLEGLAAGYIRKPKHTDRSVSGSDAMGAADADADDAEPVDVAQMRLAAQDILSRAGLAPMRGEVPRPPAADAALGDMSEADLRSMITDLERALQSLSRYRAGAQAVDVTPLPAEPQGVPQASGRNPRQKSK